MAVSCPTGFDTTRLREEVSSLYAKVAQSPQGDFHFHTGPAYAAERLGYSADLLALLPSSATSSFAGVGNPLAIDVVGPDQTVVEVGCGGGMDLLLAARRAKWVVGVDMTTQMLDRARAGVWSALASNVELRKGDAESLPVEDQYADVVISNGVLNLTTDKEQAFREVFRVLKPGGRLLLADIAVEAELSENIRSRIDLWTAWIGGALPEAELVSLVARVGFAEVSIQKRFDAFRGTSKENVAKKFGVRGVNLFARKPGRA